MTSLTCTNLMNFKTEFLTDSISTTNKSKTDDFKSLI